jgi:hypothetical protein
VQGFGFAADGIAVIIRGENDDVLIRDWPPSTANPILARLRRRRGREEQRADERKDGLSLAHSLLKKSAGGRESNLPELSWGWGRIAHFLFGTAGYRWRRDSSVREGVGKESAVECSQEKKPTMADTTLTTLPETGTILKAWV